MKALGWFKRETTEDRLVSTLVIEHPPGISAEGAGHLAETIQRACEEASAAVVGATTGFGQAGAAANRVIHAFWEAD